jgi:fumarylacetoacetate (FAA) hydrolase
MKLASIKNKTRDGKLAVVSRDLSTAVFVEQITSTMIDAVERWDEVAPELQAISDKLNASELDNTFAFKPEDAMAPLPRCYQFLDASAFIHHGDIMEQAYNLVVEKTPGIPIVLQRQSDDFIGPVDDYPILSEDENGDFEAEFAVILGDLPMHPSLEQAEQSIKLITIINDMSMRKHIKRELGMGFGFINGKSATAFAPVAVTPDELGSSWQDTKIHLDMHVHRNGEWFGNPNGGEMDFSFAQIVKHIAHNRNLKAGCTIGSGTVSNINHNEVGSACLAERIALDVIEFGETRTDFLKFGETLKFEVFGNDGQSIFGAINHKMVPAK